ncbi:MAG: hypothetical protein JO290_05260, partial [Sphingomonadaceae bacterium]|nr:hypothetical protein [Sphingomonadaceae bacterium]
MPLAATDLETRGLSAMFENTPEQTAEGVAYLQQATALAPRAAPVWGSLAMSYVLDLGWVPPAERSAVAARARDAATRGLRLDPRESRSAAALVALAPTFGHWREKAGAIAAAAARARPDAGPLAYQQVQFLMATGHIRAALAALRPVAANSPLVPWIQAARIDLLAADGQLAEAYRAADSAGRIWPRERLIWFTRFDLALFNGRPEQALAMAADRDRWPKLTTPAEVALAERTAQLLARPDPRGVAALLADYAAAAPASQGSAERAMRVAAAFDRPDVALAVARRLYRDPLAATPRRLVLPTIGLPADDDPPTAALFLPPGSTLWRDARFADLAGAIGLAAYWRATGLPDFCADPGARCDGLATRR